MDRPSKKRRWGGPLDDRNELVDSISACDSWESLHEVLRQYQKECQKDWPLEAGLKWSEEFCKGTKRPETFKDLFDDTIAEGVKIQQGRSVEEQWDTLSDILNNCANIPEMLPLIEGLIDTITPHIEEKNGIAVVPSTDVALGLSLLPVVVTPIALRRMQFMENHFLLCLTSILEALGTQEDMPNPTTSDIFMHLDGDGDNFLSRKDLQILRELRTPDGDPLDPQKLGIVTMYLEKADYQKFNRLVNHTMTWSNIGCQKTNGEMFYYYVEPMVHKYIKARRAETGPNLLDVRKFTSKKPPVEDFVDIIGESMILYQLFIPYLAQTLADSRCLLAPGAESSTSVGFEPYLSTLRWQILMSLVNNKVLVPTFQGLWNVKSRFTGQTVEYKYHLSIERNGCSGWSDLSSRNGEKTFKIHGSPPAADGSYQFELIPFGEKKMSYYIVCKIGSDLKTLEGKWGTEGFDKPMRGMLHGVRGPQAGGTVYLDSNARQWDKQTSLIVLLDKIIPHMRIPDSQTVELSTLIINLLEDPNTYVDNLMDLAFILVNPLLHVSLLRHLFGYDRPWQRNEYLSLALIRVAAIAPFHWRDGLKPPPFEQLFGVNSEGVLTLPDSLPKQELQKMFREHAGAHSETSLATMVNYIISPSSSMEPEGSWESNFVGLIINVLTAGHFIKKEVACLTACLKVAKSLPVNWVARQLTDVVVNIATQKSLDFEPAMRYPVCEFLVNRAERDVWIHRRAAEFFRDSLFARDVRAHVIWPRGKDALYFTELAARGRLRCPLCPNVPFKHIYEEAIALYDEVEGEPFMREKFQEKQIYARFERPVNMQFPDMHFMRRFDCPCHGGIAQVGQAHYRPGMLQSIPQAHYRGGATNSMPPPGQPAYGRCPPPSSQTHRPPPGSNPPGHRPPHTTLGPPSNVPQRKFDVRGPSGGVPCSIVGAHQTVSDGTTAPERRCNAPTPQPNIRDAYPISHISRIAVAHGTSTRGDHGVSMPRPTGPLGVAAAHRNQHRALTGHPWPGTMSKSELAPTCPLEPTRIPATGSHRSRHQECGGETSGLLRAHPYERLPPGGMRPPQPHDRLPPGLGASGSQRQHPYEVAWTPSEVPRATALPQRPSTHSHDWGLDRAALAATGLQQPPALLHERPTARDHPASGSQRAAAFPHQRPPNAEVLQLASGSQRASAYPHERPPIREVPYPASRSQRASAYLHERPPAMELPFPASGLQRSTHPHERPPVGDVVFPASGSQQSAHPHDQRSAREAPRSASGSRKPSGCLLEWSPAREMPFPTSESQRSTHSQEHPPLREASRSASASRRPSARSLERSSPARELLFPTSGSQKFTHHHERPPVREASRSASASRRPSTHSNERSPARDVLRPTNGSQRSQLQHRDRSLSMEAPHPSNGSHTHHPDPPTTREVVSVLHRDLSGRASQHGIAPRQPMPQNHPQQPYGRAATNGNPCHAAAPTASPAAPAGSAPSEKVQGGPFNWTLKPGQRPDECGTPPAGSPSAGPHSFGLPTELPFWKHGASLLPGGSVRGGIPPLGIMPGQTGFPLSGGLRSEGTLITASQSTNVTRPRASSQDVLADVKDDEDEKWPDSD